MMSHGRSPEIETEFDRLIFTRDFLMTEPAKQFVQAARSLFAATPDARTFWNSLFGIGALHGQLFPTIAEREAFEQSAEGAEVRAMLNQLPDPDLDETQDLADDAPKLAAVMHRASGALNVHLPRSLHAALLIEAQKEGVTLDELCAAKLGAKLGTVLAQ